LTNIAISLILAVAFAIAGQPAKTFQFGRSAFNRTQVI
jgi:hypothetical protein